MIVGVHHHMGTMCTTVMYEKFWKSNIYPGMIVMRSTVFYCDWYDNTIDRGVCIGVTSVHSRWRLQYYDQFILALQADQVHMYP